MYEEHDMYTMKGLEDCMDEGDISASEEGFMKGYLEA